MNFKGHTTWIGMISITSSLASRAGVGEFCDPIERLVTAVFL